MWLSHQPIARRPDRSSQILLQPKEEWPKIAAEPATVGSLYSNYVIYRGAYALRADRQLIFGHGVGGFTYHTSFVAAVATAILQYAMQLGGLYVFALIIDGLAPRFGGRKDSVSAFSLLPTARPQAGSQACSICFPCYMFSLCSAYTASIFFTPAFPFYCTSRRSAPSPSQAQSSP
jgi:hypothetical protein